ncbi:hypothetical protein PFISCL1PPCAC_22224, partial [Pristionchus fissidentatus]
SITPSQHRTSAFALIRLATAVLGIPAAQIVGLISDSFRGDVDTPLARFYALRNSLLCIWTIALMSAI